MLQDTINEMCCSQDISFLAHLHLYTVLIKTTSFICLCLCKFENPEQISIKPGNGEFYKNCQVVSVFGIQYMKTFMCLFVYFDHNSLHNWWSEKCFKQRL
jgi:hypothetical protein